MEKIRAETPRKNFPSTTNISLNATKANFATLNNNSGVSRSENKMMENQY